MALGLVLFFMGVPYAQPARADGTVAVEFYALDRTTCVHTAELAAGQSIAAAGAAPDLLASEEGLQAPVLRELGTYFVGWETWDGTRCSFDDPVNDDLALYPVYEEISADVFGATGASADTSQAFLLRADMAEAHDVRVKIDKVDAADEVLAQAIAADGNKVSDSYRVSFGFSVGEDETRVKMGFGLVSLSLPVSAENRTKVMGYWLDSDGVARRSAVKSVTLGAMSLNWSEYEESASGNVVVALVSDEDGEKAVSGGGEQGSGDGKKSAAGSSKPGSGKKGNAKPSSSSGASSGKPSAKRAGAAPSNADPSSPVTDSPSFSTAAQGTSTSSPSSDEDTSEDSDEPTADVLADPGTDDPQSGTFTGVLADDADVAVRDDGGSRDGGVVYGALMALIAAVACAAWWLAARRKPSEGEELAL